MTASSYISPKAVKGESSRIQGRGLFATAPIAAGEIVAIKGGHIVDTTSLSALPERLRNSEIQIADGFHLVDTTTLSTLPERLRNSEIQIADGFHLVATQESEYEPVMLFLNHSCEPNVGFRGNVVLVALRDVVLGEELTTDYALFDDCDEQMTCQCGAESCRSVISGRDWRRPELQEKYGDYFSAYLLNRIRGRQ